MSSEEIARVNRRFEEATAKGDIAGMAAVYTENGVALPPDGPVVKGHEALRGLWGSVVNDMGLKAVKARDVGSRAHLGRRGLRDRRSDARFSTRRRRGPRRWWRSSSSCGRKSTASGSGIAISGMPRVNVVLVDACGLSGPGSSRTSRGSGVVSQHRAFLASAAMKISSSVPGTFELSDAFIRSSPRTTIVEKKLESVGVDRGGSPTIRRRRDPGDQARHGRGTGARRRLSRTRLGPHPHRRQRRIGRKH